MVIFLGEGLYNDAMLKRDKILLVIFLLLVIIIFIIVVAIRNFFSELFETFLQILSEMLGCEG